MDDLEIATNPKQYDSERLNWSKADTRKSRKIFLSSLNFDNEGKTVLEIGSGEGWLSNELKKAGANVIALESSVSNFNKSKKDYPHIEFLNKSFQEFETNKKFDSIYSIMVFPHFKDINKVFSKIRDLLRDEGILHIIVPDLKHDLSSEKNKIEKLGEGEYLITKPRKFGVIVDIIRDVKIYEKVGKKVGVNLVRDKKLMDSEGCFARLISFEKVR